MKVFLQLLVLLQGEDHRDPVPVLIDNVLLSCCTQCCNLLASLWGAGTINLRSLRRVWGGVSTNPGCRPGEVIYAGVLSR